MALLDQLKNSNSPEIEYGDDSLQEKIKNEMGGAYKVDPDSPFPRVDCKNGFSWLDENNQSVFDDVKTELKGSGKPKEVEVGSRIESIRFVLLRPESGLRQYDGNQKTICNSIAAFNEDGFNRFSDRPGEVPLYGPAAYGEPNVPNKEVTKNGYYGRKGMFCADCVKSGGHEYTYNDDNGKEVTVRCSGEFELLVAITDFGIRDKYRKADENGDVKQTSTVEWKSFNELYSDETKEAIFTKAPIVRIKITTKSAQSGVQFDVITMASTGSSDPTAQFVPSDVVNLKLYLQELRKAELADKKPYVVPVKNPNDGSFFKLYRGAHEMWLCKPGPEAKISSQVSIIPQFRLVDEIKEAAEEKENCPLITKLAFNHIQDYWEAQQTYFDSSNNKPYLPFTPSELAEAQSQKSIVGSSNGNGKGNGNGNGNGSTTFSADTNIFNSSSFDVNLDKDDKGNTENVA